MSAELKERTRGYTCSGITIIDEAQFIPNNTIDNILPWVDVHKCPLLLISTPMWNDDSYFAKWYHSADNINSFAFNWSSDIYDMSQFLSEEKLEFYRKQVTEFKFRTEYLGEFADSSGMVFKNIQACIGTPSNNIAEVAGIDFGSGSNGDFTFIVIFNSLGEMIDIQYTNTMEPMDQVNWLANIINNHPTLKSVYAEKNSIGNVYISALKRDMNKKAILREFNTTNKSKKDIVEELVKAFANNTIKILNDSELVKQLQHFTIKKLSNGNYTYENDDKNNHDDAVIATCIAWYALYSNKSRYTLKISK